MAARGKVRSGGKRRGTRVPRRPGGLAGWLREANHRAHDRVNRKGGRRVERSMKAALVAEATYGHVGWGLRMLRWLLGAALVVPCVVTTWSFLALVADATVRDQFWTTTAFWYFATGVLLMAGWFATGLRRNWFLYVYVLGHELTHILFIKVFRGRVSDWGVSVKGGYVTTDKTNIVIALAPYFVPFWSVMLLAVFGVLEWAVVLPPVAEKVLYGALGFSWAFHLLWTLWMIPREQPDLRENGTFLSLVIIYLVNLLLLVGLLCLASDKLSFQDFAATWAIHAVEGARWVEGLLVRLVQAAA